MARKNATKATKTTTEADLTRLLKEKIIPDWLAHFIDDLKPRAQRSMLNGPWSSSLITYGGIPGYCDGFTVSLDPGPRVKTDGDVRLRIQVIAALPAPDVEELRRRLHAGPTSSRPKNDYMFGLGGILCRATHMETDVSLSGRERTATEAISHCERYRFAAVLGLQLRDSFCEALSRHIAGKMILEHWDARQGLKKP